MSAEQAAQVARIVQESAGTAIGGLAEQTGSQQVEAAAAEAFAQSLKLTAFAGAGFVALGLLATLALPADKPEGGTVDPQPSVPGAAAN